MEQKVVSTNFDKSFSKSEKPLAVYTEDTISKTSFNVMPGRQVEETLYIKEYRVWDEYIEGCFDRRYFTEMKKSPDHMIFLTALVHLQKMLYVYMCHILNTNYDPYGEEVVKFWPVRVEVSMNSLVRKHRDVVQHVHIEEINFNDQGHSGWMRVSSAIEGIIRIQGETPFFLVGK